MNNNSNRHHPYHKIIIFNYSIELRDIFINLLLVKIVVDFN